jgi:hypothetical protein
MMQMYRTSRACDTVRALQRDVGSATERKEKSIAAMRMTQERIAAVPVSAAADEGEEGKEEDAEEAE